MAVAAREKLAADDGAALLPGTLCCFPPPEDSDHGGWHRHFARRLAEFTRHAEILKRLRERAQSGVATSTTAD